MQIREEAAKDYGIFLPPPQYTFGPLRSQLSGPMKPLGMDDFASFHYGGALHLGTGPGIINDPHGQNFSLQRRGMGMIQRDQMPPGSLHHQSGYHFGSQQKPDMKATNQLTHGQQQVSSSHMAPRFRRKIQEQQKIQNLPPNMPPGNPAQQNIQSAGQTQHPLSYLVNFQDKDGSVSLRPAQNSIMLKVPLAKQNTITNPSKIPNEGSKDLLKANKINKVASPVINDVANAPVKNSNQTNKDEILQNTEEALNEFIAENKNIDDVVGKFKNLKIPKK